MAEGKVEVSASQKVQGQSRTEMEDVLYECYERQQHLDSEFLDLDDIEEY